MMNYKLFSLIILLISLPILNACTTKQTNENHKTNSPYNLEIKEHNSVRSPVLKQVATTQPVVALSFNGLADKESTLLLLNELDRLKINATFFLPGMRVAEEPELALEIKKRGHEIQNNTLNYELMSDKNYEQTYIEVELANQIIERELGIKPTLVRSRSGDYTDNMQLVASQLGMRGVVSFSINPNNEQSITTDIERLISRGAIINLNSNLNEVIINALEEINQVVKENNMTLTTISGALTNSYPKLPLEEIEIQHPIRLNSNFTDAKPDIFYRQNEPMKEVALTFDDWASDIQITKVLDVLNAHNIKSTFFLIGKGVEINPNLAKLISEQGHEIANHSYNHLEVTTMSPNDLQQDILKAHKIITEAIQQEPVPYFRPAKGIIDEESAKVIASMGIQTIVLYDVASFDWDLSLNEFDIYTRVIERTKPGSVINMHILDNTKTVEALPLIIEKLQSEGYTFVKLSEWIEPNGTDE